MIFKFHHTGLVVKNIKQSKEYYSKSLKWQIISDIIYDPIQKVNVLFLRDPLKSDVLYELIEPIENDSPSKDWLKKGNSMHHFCYEVTNIDKAIKEIESSGGYLISQPEPAVAFNKRKIAFILTPQKLIIELLEVKQNESSTII